MKKETYGKRILLYRLLASSLLLSVLLFSGCSSQRFELTNLDTAKKLIENYYESGQYDEDCREALAAARDEIDHSDIDSRSVVIFDIDDTAISNYDHRKDIDFGFISGLYYQWIREADDPANPEAKKFYDWLLAKKIGIVFLTGRSTDFEEETRKNLIAAGYTTFEKLISRNASEQKLTAADYKAGEREKLARQGYKIIASVGDQWSDLSGEHTGIKIKLPNYLYVID